MYRRQLAVLTASRWLSAAEPASLVIGTAASGRLGGCLGFLDAPTVPGWGRTCQSRSIPILRLVGGAVVSSRAADTSRGSRKGDHSVATPFRLPPVGLQQISADSRISVVTHRLRC